MNAWTQIQFWASTNVFDTLHNGNSDFKTFFLVRLSILLFLTRTIFLPLRKHIYFPQFRTKLAKKISKTKNLFRDTSALFPYSEIACLLLCWSKIFFRFQTEYFYCKIKFSYSRVPNNRSRWNNRGFGHCNNR